jgi:uncharacterized damage-inducible protein DinB
MALAESLLPEFDQEMASTRKALERVPEAKLAWRPHEKSWEMVELATHLINLPTWMASTINQDSLDFAPPGEEPLRDEAIPSVGAGLERFDKNVAEARAALAGCSDEKLMQPWTLLAGGQEIFTMPRIAVLRSFVMSHMIHHRAQLGVYLRLNDLPVPPMYGPTADENPM